MMAIARSRSPHGAVSAVGERFCELAEEAPEPAVLAAIRALVVATDDPAKAPFVTRGLNLLARLAEISPRPTLLEAASAATDTAALLAVLDAPETLARIGETDPLAAARARGLLARQWLLAAEGGTCSGEAFGHLIGSISRQAVDKRRRAGKLLALDLGRHGYGYPVWQVHDGRVLPGLDRVIAELDEHDPWTQVGFMLSSNSWLGGNTPLDELRRGNVDRVLATAEMFVG